LLRACIALVLGATLSRAQAPTPPPANIGPDRVTFFTEPNFRGDALTVEAGASLPDLERTFRPNQQPWSFVISSIRVEGAARAAIYSGVGFNGDRLEVTQSLSDLYAQQRGRNAAATWDRAIASIRVTGPQRVVVTQPPPVRYETAPPPGVVVVPTPGPPPPVVVHEAPPRLDRRAADMIIYRAYREVLNRPPDPQGLNTYRHRLMFEGWNERQIVEQLQRSGEARGTNADEAITKAYREVLGRDPDASGLAHYRAKWRDGWTQGQIRNDLRRSVEGRDSYVRTAITRAYRELLGREPDAAGYATYERLMREKGYSERDVRAAIISGDEYRQKHPRGR
jgi:hypothetical protein